MIDYAIPEDFLICNCAGCDDVLLSRKHEEWYAQLGKRQRATVPRLLAGRHEDRPYCSRCYSYVTGILG